MECPQTRVHKANHSVLRAIVRRERIVAPDHAPIWPPRHFVPNYYVHGPCVITGKKETRPPPARRLAFQDLSHRSSQPGASPPRGSRFGHHRRPVSERPALKSESRPQSTTTRLSPIPAAYHPAQQQRARPTFGTRRGRSPHPAVKREGTGGASRKPVAHAPLVSRFKKRA